MIVLEFTQPGTPLSINRAAGRHWGSNRKILEPWKDLAWAVAHNHRARTAAPQVPVEIRVGLQFRNARRRDPHNYTGTVVKAIVDGLVWAHLVPDDTPEWVTVMDSTLTLNRDKGTPLRCTITIRPRPEGDPSP